MKRIYFSVIAAFLSVVAFAQDNGSSGSNGSSSVSVTKTSGATNIPWLWILIGVVFLIVLIALLSGRGSNTVVEKNHYKRLIRESHIDPVR